MIHIRVSLSVSSRISPLSFAASLKQWSQAYQTSHIIFLKVLGFANCPDVSSATFIAIATSTAGKCPSVSLKISNCFTLTNSGLSLASLLASSDSKIPGFRLQTVLTSHQKYTVSYGFMLARVVTQFWTAVSRLPTNSPRLLFLSCHAIAIPSSWK